MTDSAFPPVLLNDLTLIQVSGTDARDFLQAQLTQDVQRCTADQAVLAAYCSPRGRVLATLVLIQARTGPESPLWLLLKSDIADAVIQRLRMFVLRARVSLERLDMPISGHRNGSGPEASLQVQRQAGRLLVRAPGEPVRHWVPGDDSARPDAAALARWQADDIRAGFPWLEAETRDVFIPQTLNLDLIDGLSFTKGCYPGQEVVARSHYRGSVKRRMAYVHAAIASDAVPAVRAGDDLFDAGTERPAGRIINVAADDEGLHLLAEVMLSDVLPAGPAGLAGVDLRLESPQGTPVTPDPKSLALVS
ncbi:MAG: folate-binding protein [Castellaniella sp.]